MQILGGNPTSWATGTQLLHGQLVFPLFPSSSKRLARLLPLSSQ